MLIKLLNNYKYIFLLILLSVSICITNYKPDTVLSGWDTLHPEFNLEEYTKRVFTVWQSHQGLGAAPAQAHGAELTRLPYLYLLTAILPLDMVRWMYIFTTIILGPIGMYLFLRLLLSKTTFIQRTHKNATHISSHSHIGFNNVICDMSAFIGATIYLCNPYTMQQYTVILEMFAVQFAALGFIFHSLLLLHYEFSKKHMWYFIVIILLSAPMAHTATLWYVTFGLIIAFFIGISLFDKKDIKYISTVIGLIIALNFYWMGPNLQYAKDYGKELIDSKINRLFSDEAFENNRQYGTLTSLITFKGFLYNWRVAEIDHNEAVYKSFLLKDWISHESVVVDIFWVIIWGFSLYGFYVVIQNTKKNYIHIGLTGILTITTFFLLSDTIIIKYFIDILREKISFLKELLRFPFTKFSFMYLVCYVSLVTVGLTQFFIHNYYFFTKYFKLNITLCIVLLMYANVPMWQGYFINPIIKVPIPKEYFALFDWSKTVSSNDRILTMPINSAFGWQLYKWGDVVYQGAGFTWFGIKQPTINREFDRWFDTNEQSFREFQYPIYSQNEDLFYAAIQKYNIRYVLVDKNTVSTTRKYGKEQLMYREIDEVLSDTHRYTLEKDFGNNIYVYKVNGPERKNSYILEGSLPNVQPEYNFQYTDNAFISNKNYISDKQTPTNIEYIYRDILNTNGTFNEQKISEIIKDLSIVPYRTIDLKDFTAHNCSFSEPNNFVTDNTNNMLSIQTTTGIMCVNFNMSTLDQKETYMVKITSKHTAGLPLKLCIEDTSQKMCVLEERLHSNNIFKDEYFLLPSFVNLGGYSINFVDVSVGSSVSKNTISDITVYKLPYNELFNSIYKNNNVNNMKNYYLIHNNSYTTAWNAYVVHNQFQRFFPFFGRKLNEHVLVNNWANGWVLSEEDKNSEIRIIFWPQYLEYIGFLIMFGTLVYIGTKKYKE